MRLIPADPLGQVHVVETRHDVEDHYRSERQPPRVGLPHGLWLLAAGIASDLWSLCIDLKHVALIPRIEYISEKLPLYLTTS